MKILFYIPLAILILEVLAILIVLLIRRRKRNREGHRFQPTPLALGSGGNPALIKLDKMLREADITPAQLSKQDDVSLALSAPETVMPGQSFVYRFSAYPEKQVQQVQSLLTSLAPDDKQILNVDNCKWKPGTEITVRLYSTHLKADPEIQTFTWEGKIKVLNFDVLVLETAPVGKSADVKVDVSIAGIVIARLRQSLKIDTIASTTGKEVKGRPYRTAFASYAREDINEVVGRLSEIERNGVKVFWDRLSLLAGDRWEAELDKAIQDNQLFLLFWSSRAKKSKWVEWEWQSALKYKGLDGIEPHPLEDPQTAPPPEELKALHFDDKYLHFKTAKP